MTEKEIMEKENENEADKWNGEKWKEKRETEEKKTNGWRGKQNKRKIIRRRSRERENIEKGQKRTKKI